MPLVSVNVQVFVDGVAQEHDHHHKRRLHLRWNVGPVSEQHLTGPDGVNSMLQLTDSQKARVSVSAVDKKGQAAEVQGVKFSSSDETIATVEDNGDGSASIVAGLPGTCQIQVTADADMGDGDTEITGTLDLTVVAGSAATINVTAGAPEEQ